jgi:hypothetical protein
LSSSSSSSSSAVQNVPAAASAAAAAANATYIAPHSLPPPQTSPPPPVGLVPGLLLRVEDTVRRTCEAVVISVKDAQCLIHYFGCARKWIWQLSLL